MGNYKSIHRIGKDEINIKKSNFISLAAPVKTEEEANEFIEENRRTYKDANHNCYAYVLGEEKLIQKAGDDGEPSQSAGLPILEVIKREDLTDVCVVVNRYFGGIKLGKGGLSRAYAHGAKACLDDGLIVDKVLCLDVKLTIAYQFLGMVENYLLNEKYYIKDKV
ncbi:MAG: YigZ family protein [Finegoldia sp.]|nr:YigZ family protein [Finegoldia sp.]